MELVEDNALKLDCPLDIAKTIHSFIEKSEILSESNGLAQVLVYFGIQEMQRLANIAPQDIKLTSPIESQ